VAHRSRALSPRWLFSARLDPDDGEINARDLSFKEAGIAVDLTNTTVSVVHDSRWGSPIAITLGFAQISAESTSAAGVLW